MRRFMTTLIHTGIVPGVDPREHRFIKLNNTLALIAIGVSALNIPAMFVTLPENAWALSSVFLVSIAGLTVVLLLNYWNCRLAARIYSNLFSLAQMSGTAFLLGIEGGTHLFILLVIMSAYFQYPPWEDRYRYGIVLAAATVMVALQAGLQGYDPPVHAAPEQQRAGALIVLVNLTLFIIAFMYYNQVVLRRSEEALERERARSDTLLLNVMPAQIVERLKISSGTIADAFPSASVLFADLVGFTQMSASRSPESLVGLLNEIFSSFDRLVDQHHLEKIKTIGDSYLVAGGLPEPREDHVIAVAELAVQMQSEVSILTARHGLDLKLRIGIHCGPVAAGVIGLRKFAYDLWGDTVNVASRMESSGISGGIQVTEAVKTALNDFFEFTPRGEIEIKGKGRMETFLLGARKTVQGSEQKTLP